MSEGLRPYSAEDARRLRRGIGYALLLALPGWAASALVIAAWGLGAWPAALAANVALTVIGFGLLAATER